MSENVEKKDVVETEELEELKDIEESKDDEGNDNTDWKAVALEKQGIAKRFRTKYSKLVKDSKEKKETKPENKVEKQTQDKTFGYPEKAFLGTRDIKSDEEIALVQKAVIETGQTIEQVIESPYFKGMLKDIKDLKDSKDALPDATNKGGKGATDQVEYWMEKGELPPLDQPELRRKVVNAKLKKEKQGSQFSSNPTGKITIK